MNKKLTIVASTIALGGVMLGATAYAAISGTSGYEIYKEAVKNTYAFQSITPKTNVTLKDNGALLVKVDALTKLNKTTQSMSNNFNITAGSTNQTIDVYNQNNKTIIKSSDSKNYKVQEEYGHRDEKENWGKDDSGRIKDIENVADALVGSIQNYITMNDNSDGTKEVTLKMSDSQVSPVINAVASLYLKDATNSDKRDFGRENDILKESITDKLPKLVDKIKVSDVMIDAKISKDNLIQEQSESLVITGVDAKGQAHELVITADTNLTGFNSTVPDKISLKGKPVQVIQHPDFKHDRD